MSSITLQICLPQRPVFLPLRNRSRGQSPAPAGHKFHRIRVISSSEWCLGSGWAQNPSNVSDFYHFSPRTTGLPTLLCKLRS